MLINTYTSLKYSSLFLFMLVCSFSIQAKSELEKLKQQVWDAETAFAQTMADRDLEAFASFITEDAIFMGFGSKVNRGKEMIVKNWAKLFKKEKASFAWKPERVEVLEDGSLGLSTGPVYDELGRFQTHTSFWRRQHDGSWKVVFDKGDRFCPPKKNKS